MVRFFYLFFSWNNSEFLDPLFFNILALILRADIVIVHCHEYTVQNGVFNWIYGSGQLGAGGDADNGRSPSTDDDGGLER